METKSIILLIMAILNLILFSIVLKKNSSNQINLYYSLMLLTGSFWILGLFGYSLSTEIPILRLLFIKLIYSFTLIAGFYYFVFCHYFPFRLFKPSKYITALAYIFVFGYSLFIALNNNYIVSFKEIMEGNAEVTQMVNYSIFSVVFGLLVLLSFVQLIVKYRKAEGYNKRLIKYVMWGMGLTFVLASITNLIPSFWNAYSTYWLGPLFSLINFSVIAYLIFYKSNKQY